MHLLKKLLQFDFDFIDISRAFPYNGQNTSEGGTAVFPAASGEHALFYYRYEPVDPEYRAFPQDGGFSLSLMRDGQLTVTLLFRNGAPRDTANYSVQPQLADQLMKLMDQHYWLGGSPLNLQLVPERHARFRSAFGYPGYPLVYCEDLPQLMRHPLMDSAGRYGRRLCVLFEDVCEVLEQFGIRLELDGYEFNPDLVKPLASRMNAPFGQIDHQVG